MKTDVIINRDALYALRELPSESVNCCVTSPPYYGLRDYGLDAQIGREDTPEQYIWRLVEVFRELRRVLKDDGTFWLNIADTYCGSGMKAGCKQKDLIGIPWLLAFALRSDGWYLRSDIIWLKENPMPESCRDRPSRCYEHRANQIRSFCVEPCGGCAMTHSRRDFPAPDCRAINTDAGKQAQQLVGDNAQNT